MYPFVDSPDGPPGALPFDEVTAWHREQTAESGESVKGYPIPYDVLYRIYPFAA